MKARQGEDEDEDENPVKKKSRKPTLKVNEKMMMIKMNTRKGLTKRVRNLFQRQGKDNKESEKGRRKE